MRLPRASSWWRAFAILTIPSLASAQGFGLNEIGSCAVGRAFAATAGGCKDASTIFWNPAGATSLPGWSIIGGAASVAIEGTFEQDSTGRVYRSDVPTAFVPHVFINHLSANGKLALGIGVYAPYGLTSQWTGDFPGRFIVQKASLQTIYVQPNIAWRLNDRWSIGGGPIVAHSSVELIQGVDLSQTPIPGLTSNGRPVTFSALGIAPRTEFAQARIKGDGMGYGVQLGVMGRLTDKLTIGARFMSSLVIKYDDADASFSQVNTNLVLGGAVPNPANPAGPPAIPAGTPVDALVGPQFASGGALVAQQASTRISHPAQAQAGLNYTGFDHWSLEGDVAWIGWKQFTDLPIAFSGPAAANSRTLLEQYNNSTAIRLSAEYSFKSDVKLRAGFSGVASAAPDVTVTPLLPEQDREYYTGGVALPLYRNVVLDAAYAYIATPGRRGRIDERTVASQGTELNSGLFTLKANIISLSLKASF
jgi:long-chain fatty acid transport protein